MSYPVLSFCNVPNSMLLVIVSQKCCDDISWVMIRRSKNGEPVKYLRPLLNEARAFSSLDIICCRGCGPFVINSHFMSPCSALDLHKSNRSYFFIINTVSVLFSDFVNLFQKYDTEKNGYYTKILYCILWNGSIFTQRKACSISNLFLVLLPSRSSSLILKMAKSNWSSTLSKFC